MECDSADLLLMKYMDNTLNESETERLNAHLETCESCRKSFVVYDEIMRNFTEQTVYAPDNFEALVMDKIRALPAEHKSLASADNLLCVVWGIFSVLFGLGFLAVINKDAIILALSDNPSFAAYADMLETVSRLADRAINSLTSAAGTFFTALSGYIASSRYILMLIIAVLVLVQYVVYRKNKVEV